MDEIKAVEQEEEFRRFFDMLGDLINYVSDNVTTKILDVEIIKSDDDIVSELAIKACEQFGEAIKNAKIAHALMSKTKD